MHDPLGVVSLTMIVKGKKIQGAVMKRKARTLNYLSS